MGTEAVPVDAAAPEVAALRDAARLRVSLVRTAGGGSDTWLAHVVEDVVLLEEVDAAGGSRCALARGEDLADLVVAAAVVPDAAPGTGAPPEPADRSLLVTVLLGRRGAGPPQRTSVRSGPEGTWLLPEARPVAPDAARTLLARRVAGYACQ
ncbi:hypothetical protein [Nocardioides euryhalodurans]|uniref:Uncharacterized protein n=1 Tax=Nocardioides euryhalodurans TaxID=2518370 RepID=A0A4P7GM46_9ACTN|nr:hypothetical protein [Nocardioides euryhalodurans]QBR93196.1 hypothetical protein EXE57_13665 [Nocardioides euryhalodurans]